MTGPLFERARRDVCFSPPENDFAYVQSPDDPFRTPPIQNLGKVGGAKVQCYDALDAMT
jgi:hypothetical protein